MKLSCISLYFHYCTECYSITPHTRCELLFTIIYSHDPHRKWSRCVEYCIVTNQRLCETFEQNIVLSRLTLDVKPLYIIVYSPNGYEIGICCFSAKHTALRRKTKDWLARNQNNVSEWSEMSTRDCCFCELALWKSNSPCWSRTKRTSSSSHWKLTCSRHNIDEILPNWH
jgi:hypothetical protein